MVNLIKSQDIVHLTSALNGEVLTLDYFAISNTRECKECSHTIIELGEHKTYFVKETPLEITFLAGDIHFAKKLMEWEVFEDE